MTQTEATTVCSNTILYRSYMFRRHLRHLQTALHQDLKLSGINKVKIVSTEYGQWRGRELYPQTDLHEREHQLYLQKEPQSVLPYCVEKLL